MVGLTLMVDRKPTTGVFTDPEAPEIDRGQYASGDGPCLDTFLHHRINRIESTADETRWRDFCRTAADHGIASTLSLPIVAREEPLAALNLYSRTTAAFDQDAAVRLDPFTDQAAIALANAQAYWDAHDLSENLKQALQSRATIDYAIGMIMSAGGRTPDQAFDVLVKASQRENRKVRDIAAEMVERAIGSPSLHPSA